MAKNYDEDIKGLLNQATVYLNEVEYPAHKRELVAAARERDAPEPILALLMELPEKTYRTHDDLVSLVVEADEENGSGRDKDKGYGLFRELRDM